MNIFTSANHLVFSGTSAREGRLLLTLLPLQKLLESRKLMHKMLVLLFQTIGLAPEQLFQLEFLLVFPL